MDSARRRATERLHGGRFSDAGAIYFVTFVTATRAPWLADPAARAAILDSLRSWHEEGEGSVLGVTVMPDHVHVLFRLGARLDVGQTVGRWKATARKQAGYAGAWQRDFWEHRLRSLTQAEDFGLYIYLNPYRAGLLARTAVWPGWWAPEWTLFRFTSLLDAQGTPPREWIEWPQERFQDLATGE